MKSLIEHCARPRTRERIYTEIQEQRAIVALCVDLACSFHDLDMRPILWDGGSDGSSIQRIGPDPVPPDLRENIRKEKTRLAELEYELSEAHERWSA